MKLVAVWFPWDIHVADTSMHEEFIIIYTTSQLNFSKKLTDFVSTQRDDV